MGRIRRSIQKLITFVKSLIGHVGKGMPKADQFTINSRYSVCFSCESFDKDNKQCLECGCNISAKKEFLNKLAWLDQKCPLGKWS